MTVQSAKGTRSSEERPSTGRVEAIFLSPDPEDGAGGGGSAQQELWRQTKGQTPANAGATAAAAAAAAAAAGPTTTTSPRKKAATNRSRTPSAKKTETPSVSTKRGRNKAATPVEPAAVKAAVMTQAGAETHRAGNRLRKTRSVMDMGSRVAHDGAAGSHYRGRPSFASDSQVPLIYGTSRRSSGASITVSLTGPDSPVPRLIFDGGRPESPATPRRFGNTLRLDDVTEEFLKIRRAATAVRSATRFRRGSHPPASIKADPSGASTAPALVKSGRRGSTPYVPPLNLGGGGAGGHDATGWRTYHSERLDDAAAAGARPAQRRSTSPTDPSTPRGFFLPASRPSSTLSQEDAAAAAATAAATAAGSAATPTPAKSAAYYTSRKSSAASLTLANVSRPWTPAPTPPTDATGRRLSPLARSPYRPKSPVSLANPLQSINKQVISYLKAGE